ncbi:hypothetical protein [Mycobacterium sp. AT1]|uniref:hypothetical protein n=1 Tax=Mycobacterium sp. AT1 TaxID=1961706 RepID=UPI00114FED3C|nr:hypothetical protein [Mycobacterium sp. AT1]
MSDPITGKVAAIENNYSVVINRGSNDQVKKGMTFVIEDPKGKEIRDPDNTDEILGYLPVEKIKVKVFDVQEKLCRAETFVRVRPETPYEAAARELLEEYRAESRLDMPRPSYLTFLGGGSDAKLRQALELLRVGAASRTGDKRPAVVEVNVGDTARQIG